MILAHMNTDSGSNFMDRMMDGLGGNGGAMTGWMYLMWLLWLVFSLLLVTALVLGIIALIRYLSRGNEKRNGQSTLDILKRRYAKGEISREQYRKMKSVIERKK